MIKDLKEIKQKQEYVLSVLIIANVTGANASLQHAKEEIVDCLEKLDAMIEKAQWEGGDPSMMNII